MNAEVFSNQSDIDTHVSSNRPGERPISGPSENPLNHNIEMSDYRPNFSPHPTETGSGQRNLTEPSRHISPPGPRFLSPRDDTPIIAHGVEIPRNQIPPIALPQVQALPLNQPVIPPIQPIVSPLQPTIPPLQPIVLPSQPVRPIAIPEIISPMSPISPEGPRTISIPNNLTPASSIDTSATLNLRPPSPRAAIPRLPEEVVAPAQAIRPASPTFEARAPPISHLPLSPQTPHSPIPPVTSPIAHGPMSPLSLDHQIRPASPSHTLPPGPEPRPPQPQTPLNNPNRDPTTSASPGVTADFRPVTAPVQPSPQPNPANPPNQLQPPQPRIPPKPKLAAPATPTAPTNGATRPANPVNPVNRPAQPNPTNRPAQPNPANRTPAPAQASPRPPEPPRPRPNSGRPNYAALYAGMSPEEIGDKRAEFRIKYGILQRAYPHLGIPLPTEDQSLEYIHANYQRYVQRIHYDNSMNGQYKLYLIALFLGIEFLGTRVLGMDFSGYTINQVSMMNQYEIYLIELGEKNQGSFGSNWPVEIRILLFAMFNAILFVVIKAISNNLGPELAGFIQQLINGLFRGNSRPPPQNPQNSQNSNSNNSSIPDPPPPSSGGFDVSSLLAQLGSNLIRTTAPTTGAAPAAQSKPPARRRPVYSE